MQKYILCAAGHITQKKDLSQRHTMKFYADKTITKDHLPAYLDINDEFKSTFDLMGL